MLLQENGHYHTRLYRNEVNGEKSMTLMQQKMLDEQSEICFLRDPNFKFKIQLQSSQKVVKK